MQTNADSLRKSASSQRESVLVFTIHNLGNQGRWNAKEVTKWFGKNNFRKFEKNFDFMAEGILNADLVTTVSPTYAKEILTKEYGMGLEKLLLKRRKQKVCVGPPASTRSPRLRQVEAGRQGEAGRKVCVSPRLVGILNGIDYEFWPRPPKPWRRRAHKNPRFGFVARLTYQKGLPLLLPIIPEFVEKYGAEFHFLGQGEAQFESALKKLARRYPKKVFVKIGFDEKLAHKIYTQSDFFLIPSIFEPCGLGQMISMHYGTVPVVRETGGLKDTVRHLKTGFVFKGKTSEALAKAIKTAIDYFYNKPKEFGKIQQNCRRQDFSWRHSAKKYKNLYKSLLSS